MPRVNLSFLQTTYVTLATDNSDVCPLLHGFVGFPRLIQPTILSKRCVALARDLVGQLCLDNSYRDMFPLRNMELLYTLENIPVLGNDSSDLLATFFPSYSQRKEESSAFSDTRCSNTSLNVEILTM